MITHTFWMNVQRITLCEKSQSQKVAHCMLPFTQHSHSYKIIEIEDGLVFTGIQEESGEVSDMTIKGQQTDPCGD